MELMKFPKTLRLIIRLILENYNKLVLSSLFNSKIIIILYSFLSRQNKDGEKLFLMSLEFLKSYLDLNDQYNNQ